MKTEPRHGLKRQLGSPALFGIVQGFIAASIYFSTGLVAERALGFTWMVYVLGAILLAVIVPCYVEGASLHQERGGATVIARYAFNELVELHRRLGDLPGLPDPRGALRVRRDGLPGRLLARLRRRLRGVRDRRRDRALRGAGGDPRRRPAALRAQRAAGAGRPRAAGAGGRARDGAAVRARRAHPPGADRRHALDPGRRVRVPARARRLQRHRRVVGPRGPGRDRPQGPQAADRRAAGGGDGALRGDRAGRLVRAPADGLQVRRGAADRRGGCVRLAIA